MDAEMQIPMYKEGETKGVPTAVISIFFMEGLAAYHSDFINSLGLEGKRASANL